MGKRMARRGVLEAADNSTAPFFGGMFLRVIAALISFHATGRVKEL